MNAKDLREKTDVELEKELLTLREDQFKLRIQKATGQLGQTHLLRENQRNIARVKTVLREKVGQQS
ncbi:MAG: 50S ribosomal protein L29 [Pseudomonadota bacterium]